jgi:hypothetical protein
MQVRNGGAYLGKIIGLRAEPMLFRGFDREVSKVRERVGGHKLLLLDLFERDPLDSRVNWVPLHRSHAAGKLAH